LIGKYVRNVKGLKVKGAVSAVDDIGADADTHAACQRATIREDRTGEERSEEWI
jgi:hypothetical protein